MKKCTSWILLGILILSSSCSEEKKEIVNRPILKHQETEKLKEGDLDKNGHWTEQQAEDYYANFKLVSQSIEQSKTLSKASNSNFTDVTQLGNWKSKGPYNMPGAFQFCELDEETNDVYTVTCGHYGNVQFIWKGNLDDENNWTLMTPKIPSRYEDLIAIPNQNNRRLIATHERGKIMYTDDDGQNWNYSTGVPSGIFSTIVNKQDNNVIYTTNGKMVYRSTNNGTSFSEFYTIGSSSPEAARLYSPRYDVQPNAKDVYLVVDNKFFKMNNAANSFNLVSSSLPSSQRIAMGGDSRKLWVVLDKRKWYYSTNDGANFTYKPSKNSYYSSVGEGMISGQYPGVSPENPDIIIGGGFTMQSTRNAFDTQNDDAALWWGRYQVAGSVGNDVVLRTYYHPDNQGNQFFYDKSGRLLSLRASDGGVYKSYNEWTKTSYPTSNSINTGVFYNITLLGLPSQETYSTAFMIGKNNVNDMSTGTQDQGYQNSRKSSYDQPVLSWDQPHGGDGKTMFTGDGVIGWRTNDSGKSFIRYNLYNGTTYRGYLNGTSANTVSVFNDSPNLVGYAADWNNSNQIWVIGNNLRRVQYQSAGEMTGKEDVLSNTSGPIQGFGQSLKNPDLLYALDNGNVFKSSNSGDTWSQIATQSATGMSKTNKNKGRGWGSPIDENFVLFAATSGTEVKSILSKDGGITWKNVTGSGANLFPSTDVLGMAGNEDGSLVFASTRLGPYVFIVEEEKWYPLAIQSNVPIFNGGMVYCQKYDGKEHVRFSSFGQGIWDFEINNAILPISNFDVTVNCNIATFSNSSFSAASYLWDFGDGNTSTEENPTHTYATSGDYTVTLEVTNTVGVDSNQKTIVTTVANSPNNFNETICEGASTTINLPNNGGGLVWYDQATNGNVVGTGDSYQTGILTEDKTYFVSGTSQEIANGSIGIESIDVSSGGNHGGGYYLVFDTFETVILTKAKVYAQGAGERTLELRDSQGTILQSKVIAIPDGESMIDINLKILPGTDLQIGFPAGANLFRNNLNINYPYNFDVASNTAISLKGSTAPDATAYYYYLYDWKISAIGNCETIDRAVVSINLENPPAIPTITASQSTGVLTVNETYSSYQWLLNGVVINGATSNTYTATENGTYTVEVFNDNNDCGRLSQDILITTLSNTSFDWPAGVTFYPNPVKDILTIKGLNTLENGNYLKLININGQVIKEINLNTSMETTTIDARSLSSGLYFLNIDNKYTEKIIVKKE